MLLEKNVFFQKSLEGYKCVRRKVDSGRQLNV